MGEKEQQLKDTNQGSQDTKSSSMSPKKSEKNYFGHKRDDYVRTQIGDSLTTKKPF